MEKGSKGKGGKGFGKIGRKRFKKVARETLLGITKPAIRRMARRAGIKRLSNGIYEQTRNFIKYGIDKLVKDACTYADHGRRQTVMVEDINHAAEYNNVKIYGFNKF